MHLRRCGARYCSSWGRAGGRVELPEELPEAEVARLRRNWKKLSEEDRTHMEWTYGDPYYMPSYRDDGFETFEEYESKHKAVILKARELAALTHEYYRQDVAKGLELQKELIQKDAFDEVHKTIQWQDIVQGKDWAERLEKHQHALDHKFRGTTPEGSTPLVGEEAAARKEAEKTASINPVPGGM
eukprot:TRINITY_DN6266_c0_g1_i2.p1 TRINITY_DN6266_c0_g1~~TRINITY_DN6266_c0_g1_i2.p1  ORF type:complete len:185 (+),score=57.16 TRINITY_DN6266_c0_g1_i2:102-656(+)